MPYGIKQCYLPPSRGDIPTLTQYSSKAGTQFNDPEVDLVGWFHTEMVDDKGSPTVHKDCSCQCWSLAVSPRVMYTSAHLPAAASSPHQTHGYLPSRRSSPPFGRYQFMLLGEDRHVWTTCLRLLPESGKPGMEPATYQSQVQRPNHYTTRPHTCTGWVQKSEATNSWP